jgi:hypothetical protein
MGADVSKKARVVFVLLTFAPVLLLAACSYTTAFAIVNGSGQPLDVEYKIAASPAEPLAQAGEPALAPEANLGGRDKGWRTLRPDEYVFDREARTVKVRLMPHEALLVRRLTNYRDHAGAGTGPFLIEGITLRGANGVVELRGDEARRSFVEVTETFYTLTYK